MVSAFGVISVSSELGNIYKITGSDSSDAQISKFFPRSNASGDEAMVYAGNDILYGRIGAIESLASVEQFGDVKNDDLTIPIEDEVLSEKDWEIVYNQRTKKVYFHPDGKNYIWELNLPLVGSGISPWVKLVTNHSSRMNPSAMMTCVDPDDGIEYTYWGDASGNLFRMEGTGEAGDAGSAAIKTTWRSKVFSLPQNMRAANFSGHVQYRSQEDATITIRFLFGGSFPSNESFTVTLKGGQGDAYWGGDFYWDGDNYWGAKFDGRFRREEFDTAGHSEVFQVEIEYEGVEDIEINEIGLKFSGAT